MKKLAIAVTTVAALTGSALAADMPVKASAAPVVRAVSWTGCYVGAGWGYGMWNQDSTEQFSGFPTTSLNMTAGGRGWFGTGQVGCDYQINNNWVIGAFGDFDFGRLNGDFNWQFANRVGRETESRAWAAGGRVGYLVFPQLLTYFSGGYTQARFDQINWVSNTTGASLNTYLPAHTYNGWFLGTGYEYSLAAWFPGLFWKNEYRYASYKRDSINVIDGTTGLATIDGFSNAKYIQTIRSELVYRFNLWN